MTHSGIVQGAKRDIQETASQGVIMVGGLVTSLATVALNLAFERATNFNLLSLSLWFVIPAGALIGGMAAASGYYIAARLTHTMPTRTLLYNMLLIAAGTWFLSEWVTYAMMTLDDGTRVASLMTFWDYFKVSTESMKLSIGTRGNVNAATTGELGTLGYARETLQLLGFMVGGLATYGFLKDIEACESCKRYAKTKQLLNAVSPAQFQDMLDAAEMSLPDFVEEAKAALGKKPLEGLSLFISRCPRCNSEWVRPAVVVLSGNDFDTTKLGRYSIGPAMATSLRAQPPVKRSSK